jgi:hypothetical protein
MNGYDFVERILGQTNYDVLPLTELARGAETEWLEFKAATLPLEDKYDVKDKKQANKWDYRWNVSKGLICLANHVGGALILGVNELNNSDTQIEVVSLERSEFKGNKDEFMRNVVRKNLISPDKGWSTGLSGTWVCEELHTVVTPRWGSLFGQPVLVLLVRPRFLNEAWLSVVHREGSIEKRLVPCRAPGDLGRTDIYAEEEVEKWWVSSRNIESADLDLRYQSFLDKWTSTSKKSDDETNEVIRKYLSVFHDESAEFEGVFTQSKKTQGSASDSYIAQADEFYGTSSNAHQGKSTPRTVQGILDNSQRSVLLGEPGAGKSTCLLLAASKLATSWEPGKSWGLVVDLNEFGESGLRATILRKLEGLHWVDIESKVASGELILFLDALNECPVGRYVECSQDIAALLKLYPSARVHITSRITHYPDQFKLPAFHIRPMDRAQQGRFLASYLGSSVRSEEVLTHIYRQPGATHFAGSPILLRIVAGVGQDSGEALPTGMASLYKLFLSKWFDREVEKNGANGTPALWSFGSFVDALALLAFQMRKDGLVSCSNEFARNSVMPVIGADHVATFLGQMSQGLLLKKSRHDDFLQFSHQTIQEYFAAVHLARHPEVLEEILAGTNTTGSVSEWFLALVLAFELLERPPGSFLAAAWSMEPMLVAASLRDDGQLLRLPMHQHPDLWLRGALKAMRGEDFTTEVRELALASRLPPKYPLPQALTNSLRSAAFWYAGESHTNGAKRLNRLQEFLLNRHSMWIESMPYLMDGAHHLNARMSPSQLMVANVKSGFSGGQSLKLRNASMTELCTLLRLKIVSKSQFLAVWREVLDGGDRQYRYTDLLALVRTAKEFKTGSQHIEFKGLSSQDWEILAQIGRHWKLSLRLLNVLVREGVVNVDSLRADPGRIQSIVDKPDLSPMNMFRLMKAGVIRREDMSANRLRELVSELDPASVRELVQMRKLQSNDFVGGQFSHEELEDDKRRRQIELELVTRDWEVTVSRLLPRGDCGFVSHPKLNSGAIVYFEKIDNPYGRTIKVGDRLSVRLRVQRDKKHERWGFAVSSGKLITAKVGR